MTLTEFLLARLVEEPLGYWAGAVAADLRAGELSESETRDIATVYADHPDYLQEWNADA